jgi:putative ABC transport system permease protein
MLRVTLSGLLARKLRLIATALAIILGVGFVSGTLIFSDTSKAAMYDGLARFARNVDVSVALPEARDERTPRISQSSLAAVQAVAGVSEVSGRLELPLPVLDKKGELLGSADDPGTGFAFGDQRRLRPFDVKRGQAPTGRGQVALAVETAERGGFQLGDPITVLDSAQGRHQLDVVGIVDFGSSEKTADRVAVVLVLDDLTELTGVSGYDHLVLTTAEGISPAVVADRISVAVRSGPDGRDDLRVITGDRYRFELANDAVKELEPLLVAILVFAGVACVVAAFVIYNTFTILIAQRIREIALLRCVGASRRQVFGSVLLESLVIGLVGSAMGFLLGLGVSRGLAWLFGTLFGSGSIGSQLASRSLVVTATPVIVGFLAGMVSTTVSAVVPAVRATRVPPLAALGQAQIAVAGTVRRRGPLCLLAAVVAVAGTTLTVIGLRQPGGTMPATAFVVAGGVVNFLAILVITPLVVGPLVAAVGWLPRRVFGVPLRLAVANARRSPGRTAATTAALMIGVGLMSASSVTTETVRATADFQITNNFPFDYSLRPVPPAQAGQAPATTLPATVADTLAADQRLGLVVRIRALELSIPGDPAATRPAAQRQRVKTVAIDPKGLAGLPEIKLVTGSFSDLRPGTVIMDAESSSGQGRELGDPVRLETGEGTAGTYTIVGFSSGSIATGRALLTWSDLEKLQRRDTDDLVYVKARDGVSPKDSRAAVLAVTGDFPMIRVDSMAEMRAQITSVVDTLIAVIAALLAFAIVIALIGIANTLSLSVLERTRESATTRALGLTRGQLRATLLAEAVLMSLVGAMIGIGFGVLYGWLTTRTLFGNLSAIMTIPYWQLLAYAVLTALAAIVAAVLPARRAAKASMVSAMADS